MLLRYKRIFVVEDDTNNLKIISMVLHRHGATVMYDRWGKNTPIIMVSQKPIDLVLLDLMLPGNVSGYDVYDQLQKNPELKKVPVVVVTASDPSLEMKKAREKGLQGFLSKPIDVTNFPLAIAKILEGTPVWGELD
jgi:CheY-like chemotaxis protein